MTIAQMATYFDILQDKYGSPYFNNTEKSLLLNRAQIIFVNELLPENDRDDTNLELNDNTGAMVAPLIIDCTPISNPANGSVLKSTIASNVAAVSSGAVVWRLLKVGYTLDGINFKSVTRTRHNDWFKLRNNFFKEPTDVNPRYLETFTDYQILPNTTIASLYFTVLKYPKTMDIDTSISSDLPDFTHDKIVAIALSLAGFGTRDEMLAQIGALGKVS